MQEIILKTCTVCKAEKSIVEFNKKSTSKDGYQNICRDCSGVRSQAHYQKDKESNKKRLSKNKKLAQDAAKLYIGNLLATKGCVDCGEKDPIVLDFDHLKDKKHNVSRMIHNGFALDKIVEEIAKCEIRCANCHRRKTAKDFSWWRIDINNEE